MEKIAILCDSACDINIQEAHELNVKLIPVHIIYSDREYLDQYEISAQEIYKNFKVEVPKTSMPTVYEVSQILEDLKKEGYNKFIIITFSSTASGTYQSIRSAVEETNTDAFVFDTKRMGIMAGSYVRFAVECKKRGFSYDEITRLLSKNFDNCHGYFTLSTLEYLIKGGRVGKVSGAIAKILKIYPIISCDEDGALYTFQKVKGLKNAYKKLASLMEENANGDYELFLCHGNNIDGLNEVKSNIENVIKNAKFYRENNVTAALGVHTGDSLVGAVIMNHDFNL